MLTVSLFFPFVFDFLYSRGESDTSKTSKLWKINFAINYIRTAISGFCIRFAPRRPLSGSRICYSSTKTKKLNKFYSHTHRTVFLFSRPFQLFFAFITCFNSSAIRFMFGRENPRNEKYSLHKPWSIIKKFNSWVYDCAFGWVCGWVSRPLILISAKCCLGRDKYKNVKVIATLITMALDNEFSFAPKR